MADGKFVGVASHLVESIVRAIFNRQGIDPKLQRDFFDAVFAELGDAVETGFGGYFDTLEYDSKPFGLLAELEYNAATFAAFKNHSFQKEIHALLLDDDGDFRVWSDFQKEAAKVSPTYFSSWLKTEYHHAKASANMARKWGDFQKHQKLYPNLKYLAVMDARTRPEHAKWHGIVLPIEHPFWNTHLGPNDWGCRCDAIQTDEEADDKGIDVNNMEKLKAPFNINPGKEGKVFSEEHPYYKATGYDATAKLAKNALLNWQRKDIRAKLRGGLVGLSLSADGGLYGIGMSNKNLKEILNQPHANAYERNLLLYDIARALGDAKYLKAVPDHKGRGQFKQYHYLQLEWNGADFFFVVRELQDGSMQLYSILDSVK